MPVSLIPIFCKKKIALFAVVCILIYDENKSLSLVSLVVLDITPSPFSAKVYGQWQTVRDLSMCFYVITNPAPANPARLLADWLTAAPIPPLLLLGCECESLNRSIAQVTVTILDVNDNAPGFLKDGYSKSVYEDVRNLTNQDDSSLLTISASDADQGPNSQVVYTIVSGNEEGEGVSRTRTYTSSIVGASMFPIHNNNDNDYGDDGNNSMMTMAMMMMMTTTTTLMMVMMMVMVMMVMVMMMMVMMVMIVMVIVMMLMMMMVMVMTVTTTMMMVIMVIEMVMVMMMMVIIVMVMAVTMTTTTMTTTTMMMMMMMMLMTLMVLLMMLMMYWVSPDYRVLTNLLAHCI